MKRRRRARVGELERRSPLPPGRYWLDVLESKRNDWHAFSTNHPNVDVITTQEGSSEREPLFVIFRTRKEMFWPAANFGHPNKAPGSINSRQDTATVPDVDPGPSLESVFAGIGTGGLVLLLGLLWWQSQKR